MTGKLHHTELNYQPNSFAFTEDNAQEAKKIIARYPSGKQQSAVMPLLTLAQQQNGGWLPKAAMDHVAGLLHMPPVRVYEVATFYTMYNLKPVGKHTIEVCTTTPCWLKGSDGIVEACQRRLGVRVGETTPDGQFTLREAECLGACVNAPMCSIDHKFYEDLTPESMTRIIDTISRGHQPNTGPQNGRHSSEPLGGATTLIDTETDNAAG
jgi:NADH dehydrogenase (ubiquinone) flavoprotein 2